MKTEKTALFSIAERQRNCEFSLRFILQRQNGLWKNFITMIMLTKKGDRREVRHDYGDFLIGEKLLNVEDGLKLISALYPMSTERGKLAIPDYGEFTIESVPPLEFFLSKQKYGVTQNNWPARFFQCRVSQNEASTNWNRELLKENLPYYPSLSEAAISFCDLSTERFDSYGAVYVIVLDYRARVESMKLAFSKAELTLQTPEMKHSDLIVKVFAKSKERSISLPDLHPESDTVSFDVGFQPDRLFAMLLSKQDNIKIDGKEFATWRSEDEGIFLERPGEEILSLLRAGESQELEYKRDIIEETQKNDLIESVVAFLNTNPGVILIGVNDDGSVAGCHKNAGDLQKLIHDSCDPPPRSVVIEERMINNSKIIIIDVPEGDDKPYQSKRDKNWYVRHNATDMKMERAELIRLTLEEAES